MSQDKLFEARLRASIKAGLDSFVGKTNTEETRAMMKSNMEHVLTSFAKVMGFKPVLPEVRVTLDGNQAMVDLIDPITGEHISLQEWQKRASEGVYG